MKTHLCFLFTLIAIPFLSFAQSQDNEELKNMHDEDQRARQVANINWERLFKEDSARRTRLYELIKEHKLVTGNDYYHSAMIFQHGGEATSSAMAVKHMKKAIELDPTINKWLLAAAIDRDLMRRGEPQIYGTQYKKDFGETKWSRYKIDSTKVTDEERKHYGVETLAQQREKVRVMNLAQLSEYYAKNNSIDKTIEYIKAEAKKGNKATSNVSERGINEFGYQLMAENKKEDALKIFKLNTQLYPNGFNTFDSYGECLLMVNKKEEAKKAYQKSLELNPKNENARKVLAEMR